MAASLAQFIGCKCQHTLGLYNNIVKNQVFFPREPNLTERDGSKPSN